MVTANLHYTLHYRRICCYHSTVGKKDIKDCCGYRKQHSCWLGENIGGKVNKLLLTYFFYLKGNSVWFVSVSQRKFCMICLFISREILYDLSLYLKGNSVWFVSISQRKYCMICLFISRKICMICLIISRKIFSMICLFISREILYDLSL